MGGHDDDLVDVRRLGHQQHHRVGPPGWENINDLEPELLDDYPATPEGQASWLRAGRDVVAGALGGRGPGIVYREPAWTAVHGAGWDPEDPTSGPCGLNGRACRSGPSCSIPRRGSGWGTVRVGLVVHATLLAAAGS
ncbi:hypothetical protein GCM10023169_21760 [Georgenia halophila]|uniref:Uncharacterized protein n=1 Tax=Georgenia halophila TaxID=620889 RepID=A0ABP8L9J6_9MICO